MKKDECIEIIEEITNNNYILTQSYAQLIEDIRKLNHKDVNDLITERIDEIFNTQMKLMNMKRIGKNSWVSTISNNKKKPDLTQN